MSEVLAVVAVIVSFVALARAGRAQQQARQLLLRLEQLEAGRRAANLRRPVAEPSSPPAAEGTASPPPRWPEDRPAPPPAPRGLSLWGPQFSRARISLIGGMLVLGGLAFTLRALGAPAWTLLLAVFAFAGLLYFNAQRVPWPVSGALRGLGYGVAALGVGSLSQRLPGGWGPGAVLAGLLALSAALLLDALRRREPLLGALAVGGAALSTWMLTDDLGRWSIPAAGAALLLAAVAVEPRRAEQGRAEQGAVPAGPAHGHEDGEASPDAPASRRAALALTLGAAGAVPLGWFVASASHVGDGRTAVLDGEVARGTLQTALHLTPGPLGLLPWLAFCLLALAVPLALLSRLRQPVDTDDNPAQDRPGGVPLGAAWAILAPQALVAAAVGAAVGTAAGDTPGGAGPTAGALALTLAILAALLAAARLAWSRRSATRDSAEQNSAGGSPLANAVAGSLTAGAAGVAAALALSVLGPRTGALALGGIAAALLLVGLYGRSRFWLRAGALGLGSAALWGVWETAGLAPLTATLLAPPDDLRAALLGAAPAALGLLAAWRLGLDGWATAPPPVSAHRAAEPGQPQPPALPGRRWSPTLLAGLCSAALAAALTGGGPALLAGSVALGAALLWLHPAHGAGAGHSTVPFWTAAPLLTLGSLLLLTDDGPLRPGALGLGVAAALLSGAALLRAVPRAFAGTPEAAPRGLAEAAALSVLALALDRAAQTWWPALGLPGALALLALLTAPLRLALGWGRMDALLGLGGLALLGLILAGWPSGDAAENTGVAALGGVALAAAWWLTRTGGGLRLLTILTRPFGGLPPGAGAQVPVARTLWLGGWALLVPLALGTRLGVLEDGLRPWLVASSLAVLGVGLAAAVQAHRAGDAGARAQWTAGLALIAGAGIKGALLDAAAFANPSAGLGIAALVTGLSLLAVAVLAPRPAAPAPPML